MRQLSEGNGIIMARKSPAELTPAGLLFQSLAEQVKLPFVQIAHASEVTRANPTPKNLEKLFETITLTSDAALRLMDSYLLSVRLQADLALELEPVAISSVMYDTAQTLTGYAKANNCELKLEIQGRHGPVMARREVIEAALTALGYSFIEAASSHKGKPNIVTLALRRTSKGISSGWFAQDSQLTAKLFKQAKQLKGLSKQPFQQFISNSGAGVFIADALLSRINSLLEPSSFKSSRGLAAALLPSRQLNLV